MNRSLRSIALVILAALPSAASPAQAAPATQPSTLPVAILPPGTAQKELRAYLMSLVPPFVLPKTAAEWEKESDRLRSRALEEVVFRGVPQEWRSEPTRIEWQGQIEGKGYKVRKLRYEVVPGLWVGGLLYQPEALEGRVACVLNVNGHEATGIFTDYVQARSINLVKRGLLVLALEWIGMGQLSADGYHHDEQAYLDLCGVAGVSVMYLELKRGLDVLIQQPNADPERVAVTGMSGGGWQTILISSLDTRVKLSAPNAGYGGIVSRLQYGPNMGDYEQAPPDLSAVADYTYLTAMLAPRAALLIYNDKDTCCFRADMTTPSVYDPVVPVYALLGHPERFALHINSDPGTHNYLKDNRQAFYRFVHRNFAPDAKWSDEDIPVESEIHTREELAIDYPHDNADYHSLARNLMRDLPQPRSENPSEAIDDSLRKKLKDVLRMDSVVAAEASSAGPASRPADLDAQAETITIKLGDRWTLPAVMLAPLHESGAVVVVLADEGRDKLQLKSFEPALREGRRVLIVDLLLMGECKRLDTAPYLWTLVINTLGRRPLGLQTQQLAAVAEWAQARFGRKPLRLVAQGLNASMVGLILAALEPKRFERIDLSEIQPSFKKFIDAGVTFGNGPPVFCPGLLQVADITTLVKIAEPTMVTFRESK